MNQKLTIKDINQDDKSFSSSVFWANILIGLLPIWLSTLFILVLKKLNLLNSVIQGELAIYNISTLFAIVYGMLYKQKNTTFDKIYAVFSRHKMIKFEKPDLPAKNIFSAGLPLLIIISMALYALEKLNSLNVLSVNIKLDLLNWLTFAVFLITAASSYIIGLFERVNPFKDSLFRETDAALTYYKAQKEEQKKIAQTQRKLSSGREKTDKKLLESFEKELRNQSKLKV